MKLKKKPDADCPSCGAPDQFGTFCEYCKRRLKEPVTSSVVLYGDGVPLIEVKKTIDGDKVQITERTIIHQEET